MGGYTERCRFNRRIPRVLAMSSSSGNSTFKMNLNEYMVTLEKPLGIRFAISVDGTIFVHSLKKGVCHFNSFLFPYVLKCFPVCSIR